MPGELQDRYARINEQGETSMVFRSEPLAKGVNNRYHPAYIMDDQAAALFNVDLLDPTRPAMRDGYAVLGSSVAEAQDGIETYADTRIAGLGYLSTATGTKLLVMATTDPTLATGRVYYRSDVGAGGAWLSDETTGGFNVNTEEAILFQANDGMVIIPDANSTIHTMDSSGVLYDGDNAANTNPPIGVVDGDYFLNRIWLFKQGTPSAPPELHYSKLLPDMTDPSTQFGRDGTSVSSIFAGRLQLSPNDGGRAVACQGWNETSMMAFFDSCIEEIIVESSNPQADSIRRVIEPNIGCAAPKSVVSVGAEMFFVDQFGQVRSLQQTVTAAQAGVIAKPLSDPIAAEMPGRVNLAKLSKVKAIVFKDRLYVSYPRLNASQANAIAVYSLADRVWDSIWIPGADIGHWVVSDVRGSGDDLWSTDGGDGGNTSNAPAALLYRWFAGTFTDNGARIAYSELSKAYNFMCPENDKISRALEVEAIGDLGARAYITIVIDDGTSTTKLAEPIEIVSASAGTFPLLEGDFPQTVADFPWVQGSTGLTRKKYRLDNGDLPNCGRGRSYQVKIETDSTGKQFARVGYRIMVEVQPYEET